MNKNPARRRIIAVQRALDDLALAEREMTDDPRERRWIVRGVIVAVAVHAAVLFGAVPFFGAEPRRINAPVEQAMQVQFLKPPAPPPKVEQPKPTPVKKKIPRPDPEPDRPEPVAPPEPPPAPPQATAPPQPAGPVRVAPGQGPGLIKRVEPVYPRPMQVMRQEGTVVLDAVIRRDGSVADIKVLQSSNPAFTQSAVDAIKQWRYSPSAYDVVLTVTVNFTLQPR